MKYELRPFPAYGDLFTLSDFRKRYGKGGVDGHGYWATADGYWFDSDANQPVFIHFFHIVAGETPDERFTHVLFFDK